MLQGLVRVALTSTVCILLALLVARLRVTVPSGDARGRASAADIRPDPAIFDGVEVRQEFPAQGTRIRSVELQLATFGRKNKGKLILQVHVLVDGQWLELAERRMRKRELEDCAWQPFGFAPALVVEQGQQIALTLIADRDADNAIAWWMSPDIETKNHRLLINGVPRAGYAHFSVDYEPFQGKAGYRSMRPRLWRRLTVFLDPLGQTMLAGGFLLGLFCFVHLFMHPLRAQPISSPPARSKPDGSA